jgi:AraC-like DNA-binding protein
VRLDWACSVRNIYQVFVGQVSLGDPSHVEPAVQRMKQSLPAPLDDVEKLHLRQSLALFMDQNARGIHQRLHVAFAMGTCRLDPPGESEASWLNPSQSVDQLLDEWGARNAQWSEQHHELPPVLRALQILRDRFADPLTTDELAELVGASRTTLMDRFTSTVGLTVFEYLARVRVREGLCLLRTTAASVEDVARLVGYQSSNKFYGRVHGYTGLKPSQVRTLEGGRFEHMLDECIPLWVQQARRAAVACCFAALAYPPA